MNTKYPCRQAVVVLLMAALLPLAAQAEQAQTEKTILVLDASGSMWGQIEGESKIAIARSVIDDLLDSMPPERSLGLSAYGHREKGNCADIELLVPPGPDTRDAIREAVARLNPRGKTPLSDAVVAAAEALKYEEEKASVILISDGRETCDRDPCEVGRRLDELGVDFTAHVVGFDVDDSEDQAQLRCLAENTGGRFFSAGDAGELSDALEAVSQPEPEPAEASLTAPETGLAGGTVEVEWAGPDEERDYIAVAYKGESANRHINFTYTEEGSPLELTLPPEEGEYELRYIRRQGRQILAGETITVEPVQATLTAPDTAAAGDDITVEWEGPDYRRDYIAITRPDDDPGRHINFTYTKDGSPLELKMPAESGDYEIRYIQRQDRTILARHPITVEPVEASVSAPDTAAAGDDITVEWEGPDYRRDYIAITRPDNDSGKHINFTYTKDGSPLELQMPPEAGDYEIRYIQRQDRTILARHPITVEPVEASLSAPETAASGAHITVDWEGPDYRRDYIAITRPDNDPGKHINFTYTKDGSPLELQMPPDPGDYEIRYIQRQDRTVLARRAITVEPVEVSLLAPETAVAGENVSVEWQGPDYRRDYISVARPGDESGNHIKFTYTNKGSPLELEMPSEAGDYEIRYIQRQGRRILERKAITVEPGDG
ncbi:MULTISPECIES: VWA domain-containing protein [unclassified Wenzhouxiangella]|uniref:VWA domain-containing protein n=1 Tax=unclassified Wenzhouxiangella TaxID=2613841 RepID=UPI0011C023E3|nr:MULTISPECIES: VWA domain-containing protein [unclassified Wenzhouxiangella]